MRTVKKEKILMVDDEPNVLSGYQRTVGRTHALTVAEGGAKALEAIKTAGPFAVIITDMRMPSMSGLQFLESARPVARETVFMMLTGNADQQTAVDAVNRGRIYRFLSKPCAPEMLDQAIRAAVHQYELVSTERVLLRETLTGSIKLLVDALELTNPYLASIQTSVKNIHQQLCRELKIVRDWHLTVSSSLCLIGLVTMPNLKQDDAISDESLDLAASLGARLISNLPRLTPVAEMIGHQRDLGTLPQSLTEMTQPEMEQFGARLLRLCVDVAREQRKTGSVSAAVQELQSSGAYDKRLVAALLRACRDEIACETVGLEMSVDALQPGMQIDADVMSSTGVVLLARGQELTELSIVSLSNCAKRGEIGDLIRVRTQSAELAKAA